GREQEQKTSHDGLRSNELAEPAREHPGRRGTSDERRGWTEGEGEEVGNARGTVSPRGRTQERMERDDGCGSRKAGRAGVQRAGARGAAEIAALLVAGRVLRSAVVAVMVVRDRRVTGRTVKHPRGAHPREGHEQ